MPILMAMASGCAKPTSDEAPEPNFGPLQVGQDADGAAGGIGGLANPSVVLLVIGMFTVGEVHACDVHSVLDQAEDSVLACDSRTKSTNNLCATFHALNPNSLGMTSASCHTAQSPCNCGAKPQKPTPNRK